MEIFAKYLIFFFVGILQDLFITYYYYVIAKEYFLKATVASVLVTLLNLIILYKILTGIEDQAIGIILIYALGNGVGTAIILKRHKIRKIFLKLFR